MIRQELNIDRLSPALLAVAEAVDSMTPVMQDIGEYLLTSTRERFPKGEAPDGSKWAPKSPATLEAYGARKSNRVDTRPLFGPTGLLSQQIFYQARPNEVEWGSNRIYAAVMQLGAGKGAFGTTSRGSPIPWGNIPARPYLGLSAEDETQIVAILSDYLQTAANGGA